MNEKYFKTFVADLNKASTLSFKDKVLTSCKIIKVIFTKELKKEQEIFTPFDYMIVVENSFLIGDKVFTQEHEAVNYCLTHNYTLEVVNNFPAYEDWVRTAPGVNLKDYGLDLTKVPKFSYITRRNI